MHEVGLVADALKRALALAEDARASKIDRLVFAIAGDHVTPDAVETIVWALSRGTIAQDAEVIIERRPVDFRCIRCGTGFSALDAECPVCGSVAAPAAEFDDLVFTGIDVAH